MKVIGKTKIKWSALKSKFSCHIGLGIPMDNRGRIVEELQSTRELFDNTLGVFWGFIDKEEGEGYQWRWIDMYGDDPKTLKDQSIQMLEDAFKILKDVAKENREKSSHNKSITLEAEIP
jgi:hypothetical protein